MRRGDFLWPGLAHHREDSVSQGRVKIGGKGAEKTKQKTGCEKSGEADERRRLMGEICHVGGVGL